MTAAVAAAPNDYDHYGHQIDYNDDCDGENCDGCQVTSGSCSDSTYTDQATCEAVTDCSDGAGGNTGSACVWTTVTSMEACNCYDDCSDGEHDGVPGWGSSEGLESTLRFTAPYTGTFLVRGAPIDEEYSGSYQLVVKGGGASCDFIEDTHCTGGSDLLGQCEPNTPVNDGCRVVDGGETCTGTATATGTCSDTTYTDQAACVAVADCSDGAGGNTGAACVWTDTTPTCGDAGVTAELCEAGCAHTPAADASHCVFVPASGFTCECGSSDEDCMLPAVHPPGFGVEPDVAEADKTSAGTAAKVAAVTAVAAVASGLGGF